MASGKMQPPVLAVEVEQRIAARLELRSHDLADEQEMVTAIVDRMALALERAERSIEQRHSGFARTPGYCCKPVFALSSEAVRRRLLTGLEHVDREMVRFFAR